MPFDGATLVGTATAAPYSASLSNVAAGSHSYTARAADNQGVTSTSAAVNVIVNVAPGMATDTWRQEKFPNGETVFRLYGRLHHSGVSQMT